MADHRDDPGPLVRRAIDALRELPPIREEMVARIVEAAARSRAQDAAPNDDDLIPLEAARPSRRLLTGVIAAAAAVVMVSLVTCLAGG